LKKKAHGTRRIATEKAKHDHTYQERVGIVDGPADDLAPEVSARIQRTAKRIYRTLGLDGFTPFRTLRIATFDGESWTLTGDPLSAD
jgi:hypothetical protein